MNPIAWLHQKGKLLRKPSLLDILSGVSVLVLQLATYLLFAKQELGLNETIGVIGYSILAILVLPYCNSYKKLPIKLIVTLSVLSLLFTIFITLGLSLSIYEDVSLCFGGVLNITIWFAQTIIYGFIIFRVISEIATHILFYNRNDAVRLYNTKVLLLILLLPKLLVHILFWPCFFDFDSAVGLRCFLDPNETMCNHHPIAIQAIHALFFSIGRLLGYPSIGMGLLSLLLIVFSTFISLYAIKSLRDGKISNAAINCFALFIGIFPLFPLLSNFPSKDGFFAYSFLLYVATLYRMSVNKGESFNNYRFIIIHFLSIILVCITRHQGIYIVLIETILLIIIYRTKWLKICVACIIPIIIYFIFNSIILNALNVEPTCKKESYGSLFQQTALYVLQHENEVTDKEYKTIDRILKAEKIKCVYQKRSTDLVKGQYRYTSIRPIDNDSIVGFQHVNHNGEEDALKEYRKVWLSMGVKHPESYIEATTMVIYGYFYNTSLPLLILDTMWTADTYPKATTKEYSFYQISFLYPLCAVANGLMCNLPICSFFASIPYYIWFGVLLVVLAFYRNDRCEICCFIPLLLSIGVIVLCPVLSGRYVYPISVIVPYLGIILTKTKTNISL